MSLTQTRYADYDGSDFDDEPVGLVEKLQSKSQAAKTPAYNELDLIAVFEGGSTVPVEYDTKIKGDSQRRSNPLDPSPPQFHVRPDLPADAPKFGTMVLYSAHEHLYKGFNAGMPEALAMRRVKPDDWKRFIEDMCYTQHKYSSGDKALIYFAATLWGRDGGSSFRLVKRRAGRKTVLSCQLLVDAWNVHFFNPRNVHIVLQSADDLRQRAEKHGKDDVPAAVRERPSLGKQAIKISQLSGEKCRLLIFDLSRTKLPPAYDG